MSRVPLKFSGLLFLALLTSCVERFYPEADEITTGLLVINAHLTDESGLQSIEISRSSTLVYPKFQPEYGAYARLVREDGEAREFFQSLEEGYYSCDFDEGFLLTGASYQIQVITSDGEEYQSDFDRLRPAPDIDSIYYKIESEWDMESEVQREGIRFYIDFTYDDEAFEYIRWELTETYEFHNPLLDQVQVWESRWRRYTIPPEELERVCYLTYRLQDIHSMAMNTLDQGTYIQKPFSFVANIQNEQKLCHKYSLLVRQYSIGPEAYFYWNELRKTSQEQGFLFDTQPSLLVSNICNINDKEEKVLGFFSMAGVQSIRGITGDDLSALDQRLNPYYCLPVDRGPGGSDPAYYPTYYATATYDGATVTEQVNDYCVDCRFYEGSTSEKPDYW